MLDNKLSNFSYTKLFFKNSFLRLSEYVFLLLASTSINYTLTYT